MSPAQGRIVVGGSLSPRTPDTPPSGKQFVGVDIMVHCDALAGQAHENRIGCAVFLLDRRRQLQMQRLGSFEGDLLASAPPHSQDEDPLADTLAGDRSVAFESFDQLADAMAPTAERWCSGLRPTHGIPCLFRDHAAGPGISLRLPLTLSAQETRDQMSSSPQSAAYLKPKADFPIKSPLLQQSSLRAAVETCRFLVVPSLRGACADGVSNHVRDKPLAVSVSVVARNVNVARIQRLELRTGPARGSETPATVTAIH